MILGWVVTGLVVGWAVAAVICYVQPKRYQSRAVVAAKEKPGRTVELAPIHAAQLMRLTSDVIVWDQPVGEAIAEIRKRTRITASESGVEIVSGWPGKADARDIAVELAWLFRGMELEEQLGRHPVDLPDLTESDLRVREERRSVERIMKEETLEALGMWNFRKVPILAKG